MLNLEKTLERNESLSNEINEIFSLQKNSNLTFKKGKGFLVGSHKVEIDEAITSNIKEIDPSLVLNNPYLKKLSKGQARNGKWSLKTLPIKENELFVTDETRINERLEETTPLGYFAQNIEVPAIYEGERIWMSLVPHEIKTMQKALDNAKGKVLAYGLGLGYFPLMAAMKENVKEVTVIEKENEPIEIFENLISESFKESDKIRIVKEDAFSHLTKVKDGEYDTIFVDIWHDAEDGLRPYSRFLDKFMDFEKTEVSYWIEETILSYARRVLEILLIEKENGADSSNYKEAETKDDRLINDFYKASKAEFDEKDILSSSFVRTIVRNINK